jgi:hypothetical protein
MASVAGNWNTALPLEADVATANPVQCHVAPDCGRFDGGGATFMHRPASPSCPMGAHSVLFKLHTT